MGGKGEVKVGEMVAVLRNVRLPFGLEIEEVKLKAEQATVDKDPFRLDLPKPGVIEAKVNETELARFLEGEAPGGLKGFKVRLKDGKVYVMATASVIISVPVSAVCTLRIVDGRQLMVDLESVDVMGMGPRSLVETQLQKINPVVDVREFPFDVFLTRVKVADGYVFLDGNVGFKPAE